MSTFKEMEEIAFMIIKHAFYAKRDKAGMPYINHLIRIWNRITGTLNSDSIKIVALLHDLLEDCPEWNEKSLRTFFPDCIVDTVVILTRRQNESYENYIERVIQDDWARIVKKEDLTDNMDLTRLPELTKKDIDRTIKYHKAYQKIVNYSKVAQIA